MALGILLKKIDKSHLNGCKDMNLLDFLNPKNLLALTLAAMAQTANPSNQYYLTHCGCARPPWGRRLFGIEWIDSTA
jgi:hypothetical protein